MIRQICNIKLENLATVRPREPLAKLEFVDLDLILRKRWLRWLGHVELINAAVTTAYHIHVGRGAEDDVGEID